MEYQKMANLLGSVSNQPSKFRTRNWVEINDESRGTYTSNDIKFKTAMLRSNLCADKLNLCADRIICRCIRTCKGNYNNNCRCRK